MDISKENTIITSLSRQPVSGSLNDVITTVHYQIFASASINGTSSLAYVQKNLDLESPNPNAFTPFDDITKSVIYGWIQSPQGELEYNQAILELEQILSSSILAEKVETLPVSMSLFER
tara:strand:+ start:103 stop:459 length:357 start_codon:yes stop_codon:yes gene_type:complete